MLSRYIFTSISILWLGLIAVLSLIDQKTDIIANGTGGYSETITMPPDLVRVVVAVGSDNIFHSLAYAVAGILVLMLLWERFRRTMPIRKAMIIAIVGLCIYGIILEILQVIFTNRSGEVTDALSNTLGAIIGVLVMVLVFRRTSWLNWHN